MTANQQKELQKKLIRATVLFILSFVAVVGIDTFSSRYIEIMENDLQGIDNQVLAVRTKYNQSLTEQKTSLEAIDFYSKYAGSPDFDPQSFTRPNANDFLRREQEKYGLNSAQITVGSFIDQPATKKETAILSKASASIKAAAAYDIPIYNLLSSLARDFPGDMIINNLTIKRAMNVDAKTINDISLGRTVNVVTADINFDWYQTKDLVGTPIRIGNLVPAIDDTLPNAEAAPEQNAPLRPAPEDAILKPLIKVPSASASPAPAQPDPDSLELELPEEGGESE